MHKVSDLEDGLVLRIDGTRPLSAATIKAVEAVCDRAEDRGGAAVVSVYVSGTPAATWAEGLNVSLVTKWERVLRRLERLTTTTVAVASGDCGGPALDALLATDYRIAATGLRLRVTTEHGTTWPGMALFRLSQQVGVARTRRAVMFGTPIDAGEALHLSLVDEVADDPETALDAVAKQVGAFGGRELAIRRQLMFDATTTSFEDALGAHLAACDRALRHRGAAEALS